MHCLAKWHWKWNTCSLSIWDLIRDREFGTACVLTGKLEYVSLTSSADIGRTSSGSASAKGGRGPPILNDFGLLVFRDNSTLNTWQKWVPTSSCQAVDPAPWSLAWVCHEKARVTLCCWPVGKPWPVASRAAKKWPGPKPAQVLWSFLGIFYFWYTNVAILGVEVIGNWTLTVWVTKLWPLILTFFNFKIR